MSRNFIFAEQTEVDVKLAESIESREQELMQYDFEKQMREEAIANLGGIEWTESNRKYKGMNRDSMIKTALADGLDSVAIGNISDLLALDIEKINLEAVKIETKKSERIYDSYLRQLPEGKRRDDAVAKVKADIAAKEALTTI